MGMKRYSKRPDGVHIAVFGISALAMGTWWYPLTKSILENTVHPSRLAEKSKIEGRG